MNRKQFGHLIATLRQDMEWTQYQLAEFGGIDLAIISQLERGVKKHLDPELLLKLANTLHLTTQERKEFLLAASGIDNAHMVRQPSAALATDSVSADRALTKMTALVEALRVPAFLLDVYADVLAANYMAFAFFQVPPEMMENA